MGRFFHTISTIWQIGVGSDRFGNVMHLIGEFGLVNVIGFVRFVMDSSCLGGSGRISVDSLGFRGQV